MLCAHVTVSTSWMKAKQSVASHRFLIHCIVISGFRAKNQAPDSSKKLDLPIHSYTTKKLVTQTEEEMQSVWPHWGEKWIIGSSYPTRSVGLDRGGIGVGGKRLAWEKCWARCGSTLVCLVEVLIGWLGEKGGSSWVKISPLKCG